MAYSKFFFEDFFKIIQDDQALATQPTADQLNAGIKKLTKYGAMVTVDILAGGDILKYDETLNMSYGDIRMKMLIDKDVNDYKEKLQKILFEKNK